MNKHEKEFWDQYKRWYLDDIERCFKSSANFATMTLILTTIDSLGGFYNGLIKTKITKIYKCSSCEVIKKIKKKKWLVPLGGKRLKLAKEIYNIKGHSYEVSGNRDVFVNFIKNYMNNFYQKVLQGTKEKRAVEILYSHFRNGFVHEGGPKFGTGIYKSDSSELFKPYPKIGIFMAINLTSFYKYFKNAFADYENDLFDIKQPERLDRWRVRMNYLLGFK